MKKVVSIALAMLLALSAVASFAIVNRTGDATGNDVWFDGVYISTNSALANYTLVSASALADPARSYVVNELVFGYLKFIFDEGRPNDAKDIKAHITSEYASFPQYLNQAVTQNIWNMVCDNHQGKKTIVHFSDSNGILSIMPDLTTPASSYAYFGTNENTSDNEFIVCFDATTFNTDLADANATPAVKNDFWKLMGKTSGNWATTFYAGFAGVVKANTASQGIIKAYVVTGGSDKFVNTQVAASAGSLTTSTTAPYIDLFKDGVVKYRVYKLDGATAVSADFDNPAKTANEYLVHPFIDSDTLEDFAIGFQNASKSTYRKMTYRKGLMTDPDKKGIFTTAATASIEDVALGAPLAAGVDLCYETYGAGKVCSDGNLYKFFYCEDHSATAAPTWLTLKNQLDSTILPIMDFFGFSLGYYNATRDSDYENAGAGWNDAKTATFNYWGSGPIETDDDDVVPAETGDASSMIVIVLAASAMMAAAALFFVMKKARD